MLRKYILILSVLSLTAFAGCKKGETETTTPEPEPTPEPAPEPEPEADEENGVRFEGARLVIPRHIQFATGSDEILPESGPLLDSITALLRRARSVDTLHVTGHTDQRGSEEDNQSLSERRAAAVVAALRERGLTLEIDSAGRGESEPLCTDNTPECDERNRRVEFVVERRAE
ncbi:MAG: OmpA family protein [Polyangiales bacterium]|nr:OmpA family protein [Myxococcales bacterium]MCB9660930.1 OmpA family protein [Sandaracinaceae bacterium]